MEWDFSPKQVVSGEIEYSQEDFLRDLTGEVDYNFSQQEKRNRESVTKIFYCVCYFTAIGLSLDQTSKRTGLPLDLIEMVKEIMEENIAMLEAVLMRKFLANLELSKGLLDDATNLQLLNAEVRNFHIVHNL